MVTKKSILIVSMVGTALSFFWERIGNVKLCTIAGFNSNCWSILGDAELILLPISSIIFLFSLITYKMRNEIFHAWWNFARWMVPVIALATIAIQFMPSNGGFFNMDSLIYLMVLAPLYSILILVSLYKIFRAYQKLK
jgi:hypothetical protein